MNDFSSHHLLFSNPGEGEGNTGVVKNFFGADLICSGP